MPAYDYECKSCGNNFEVVKSIKDDLTTECPQCHIFGTNRLISARTTFTLKGNGWAADNYSKGSN